MTKGVVELSSGVHRVEPTPDSLLGIRSPSPTAEEAEGRVVSDPLLLWVDRLNVATGKLHT